MLLWELDKCKCFRTMPTLEKLALSGSLHYYFRDAFSGVLGSNEVLLWASKCSGFVCRLWLPLSFLTGWCLSTRRVRLIFHRMPVLATISNPSHTLHMCRMISTFGCAILAPDCNVQFSSLLSPQSHEKTPQGWVVLSRVSAHWMVPGVKYPNKQGRPCPMGGFSSHLSDFLVPTSSLKLSKVSMRHYWWKCKVG